MKTRASLFLNIASVLIILASFDVGTALVYLLLAGEIPALHIKISANTMLTAYAIIFVILSAYFIHAHLKLSQLVRQQLKVNQLPKRRFHQAI